MAAKKLMLKASSQTEVYIKKIAAGVFLLSFIIITLCVLRLEVSLYHQMMYIIFDSLIVFLVLGVARFIVSKVLITYEEMDGGQG